MASSTTLKPIPTAFGSLDQPGDQGVSGPESQPGKASVLRGTRTDGPDTATRTISRVDRTSAPKARRPDDGRRGCAGEGAEPSGFRTPEPGQADTSLPGRRARDRSGR